MSGSKNNWQDAVRNGRSFLLRCWQEGEPLEEEPGQSSIWRFALVQLNDCSRAKGFACLEELLTYLRAELDSAA